MTKKNYSTNSNLKAEKIFTLLLVAASRTSFIKLLNFLYANVQVQCYVYRGKKAGPTTLDFVVFTKRQR